MPKAIMFYFHGTQSHAGWLTETAVALAHAGILVAALDRRGSGMSAGRRGDVPSAETLFHDYRDALDVVTTQFANLPVILWGQSLGGSILVGFLASGVRHAAYDGIVLCAPGLAQIHARLSRAQRAALAAERTTELYAVGLADEDYTDDPHHLAFIKNDPLCVRHLTKRARAVFLEIEASYLRRAGLLESTPCLLLLPEHDPIINTAFASSVFALLTLGKGVSITLPTRRHYLELGACRRAVVAHVSAFSLSFAAEARRAS